MSISRWSGMPASTTRIARLIAIAIMSSIAMPAMSQDSDGGVIEEVIVTAQKREQNLQAVGVSVTALGADALANGGVTDISRLELLSPGVTYGFIGTDAKVAIRGANSNNTFGDNSSIAGAFMDGVYMPRAAQQRLGFFDVERIEVLKGPQGTLYGRNTFAGAINIYTRAPNVDEVEMGADVTLARFDRARTELFANAPISDSFAVRVAGVFETSDGHIRNIGPGRNLGIDDQRSYRVSALWLPTDTVEVIARYTSLDEGGTSPGIFAAEGLCAPKNGSNLTDMLGTEVDCRNPALGAAGPDSAFDRPWVVNYDVDNFRDVSSDQFTLEVNVDWDAFSLKSITSFTDFSSAYDFDGDFSPNPGYPYFWDEDVESFTQELVLNSASGGPFEWTAGAYFSTDELFLGFSQFRTATYDPGSETGMDAMGNVLAAFGPTALIDPFSGGNFSDFEDFGGIDTDTIGLFAQVEWFLTDEFSVTAGIRYNEEDKNRFRTNGDSGFAAGDAPYDFVQFQGQNRPRNLYSFTDPRVELGGETFDDVTWRLGFNWNLSEESLVFANVSTGFLSGGLNSNGTSFEQQESEAYELGYKSRWLDNRLQFNASLYRNEFTNLTTQVLTEVMPGVFITETLNGGEQETNGLELELTWLPVDQMTIVAHASFMDNEYGEFGIVNPFQLFDGVAPSTPEESFISLRGTTPGWSPDVAIGISADYQYDLGDNGTLTPYLQFYYSDGYATDDVSLYSTQFQDSYTKTDFRLTWDSPEGNWAVSAFIENIEDEAVLARTNTGGRNLVQGSYLYPQNYGVKFSYRY